jgi:hypothetical protein
MIEELLTAYFFKKMSKQMIQKVPYCLLFALTISFFHNDESFVLILAPSFLVAFLISSSYFNYEVNKMSENLWSNLKIKGVIREISRIFEGGASYVRDMKISKKKPLIVSGFLSGFFFLLTLTSAFLLLLGELHLQSTLIVAFSVVTVIYLMQDMAKPNLLEEPEKESRFSILYDAMNAYLVENPLQSVPVSSKVSKIGLALGVRLLGPLTYVSFPKFAYRELIVFNNNDLRELLRRYYLGHDNIRLNFADGQSLDNFFVTDTNYENVTVLSEKSPKEVFPYLLNPDYSYSPDDRKKWTALSILKKQSGKEVVVGHLFLHMFRGKYATTKPRLHTQDFDGKPKRKEIVLFTMLGDRSTVHYLETRISSITARCPLDKLVWEG